MQSEYADTGYARNCLPYSRYSMDNSIEHSELGTFSLSKHRDIYIYIYIYGEHGF